MATMPDSSVQSKVDSLIQSIGDFGDTVLVRFIEDENDIDAAITESQKGAANGVAPLDGSSLIPAVYLPSFVDDVIEAANFAALPAVGEGSKIYITLNDSKSYRWTGSAYLVIAASPGTSDDVTEGVSNLYFTAARVRSTLLSGLNLAISTAVSVTDTVLTAIGKLQAQIAAKASLAANLFTGPQSFATTNKGTVNSGTVTFSFANSNFQRLQVGGPITIATAGWPAPDVFGQIFIALVNGGAFSINWPSIMWQLSDGNYTTNFSLNEVILQANGTDWVMLWTIDGGITVFGKIMR